MNTQPPELPRMLYSLSPNNWTFDMNVATDIGLNEAIIMGKLVQLLVSDPETRIFSNNAWNPKSINDLHIRYFNGFFKTATTYRTMNRLRDQFKLLYIEVIEGRHWFAINWANWLALNPPINAEQQALLAQFDYQQPPTIELGLRNRGFIYILEQRDYRWYKIGKTKNLSKRLPLLDIQLPFPVTTLHTIATDNMVFAEAYLHKHFVAKRLNGEWFQLDQDDLQWLCAIERLDDEVKK